MSEAPEESTDKKTRNAGKTNIRKTKTNLKAGRKNAEKNIRGWKGIPKRRGKQSARQREQKKRQNG